MTEALKMNEESKQVFEEFKEKRIQAESDGNIWRSYTSLEEIKTALHEAGKQLHAELREKDKDRKLTTSEFIHILRQHAHFILIENSQDSDPLALYNPSTGLYDISDRLRYELYVALDENYPSKDWKDIDNKLIATVEKVPPTISANYRVFSNGIYLNDEKKLIDFTPDMVFTARIECDYNPNAKKKVIDGMDIDDIFNDLACGDSEIVRSMWEVLNECTNPNSTRKKAVYLVGRGNSGKSMFEQLIIYLIGEKNFSSLKPKHFNNDFSKEQLIGKAVNIGDDISSEYLNEVEDLMSVITGDPVHINRKYKPAITVRVTPLCIFSMNKLPNTRNKSDGWLRRMLILPFNADFNGDKGNPRIKEEYIKDKEVLEYILKRSLELDFEQFSEPAISRELLSEYQATNDYMVSFIDEVFIPKGYDELDKYPNYTVRNWLQSYLHELGASEALPQSYMQSFAQALEMRTGNKYENDNKYYSEDEQKLQYERTGYEFKGTNNRVRSVFKVEA